MCVVEKTFETSVRFVHFEGKNKRCCETTSHLLLTIPNYAKYHHVREHNKSLNDGKPSPPNQTVESNNATRVAKIKASSSNLEGESPVRNREIVSRY